MVSTKLLRSLQLANRFMQWSSAVIVMSLTSYLINRNPHGEHIIYQEVIVRVFYYPLSLLLHTCCC